MLNNPLRYTDPTGHCIEDACILEAAGAYWLYIAAGIALTAAEAWFVRHVVPWLKHNNLTVLDFIARFGANRGLNQDDEVAIEKINKADEFLPDHPDLESDVETVENGGTLREGYDHISEAKTWFGPLLGR
ncbi:MAG: hypothetical protein NVS2B7_40170 [Herpetosiphon sp.]